MRVLIAEDDASVATALAAALTQSGHRAEPVARGGDVLLRHHDFDALMLDLGLEDTDGFDVIRRLRLVTDLPVLVVTARGDERSTVLALRLGADDYLVKPVRLRELLARLDVVARRRHHTESPALVRTGTLEVDLVARRVSAAGEELALTPTEFALLGVLARRVGAAVSREQILDEVWADAYAATSRAFDVHLAQLRQKLPEADVITTIRGYGYRLEAR
ncbi:response regulator transcription factor [Microbacterium protaetiae]|uniref:Response regulator transcription factor n=1 Tax=Microbacterium protaetiae TaxID=2509458 RepID=A0A4P6EAE4_9MICO|nr:response regulator transcription factor [Microbacterium protaetiae]QAY59102.1 response regulator transcription factor [Microbacterium protaetiae]